MNRLDVDVVAPDQRIWSGPARAVSIPSSGGDMGILPGHVPILATLRAGRVRITPVEGTFEPLEITGGFVSVDDGAVTVVVERPL